MKSKQSKSLFKKATSFFESVADWFYWNGGIILIIIVNLGIVGIVGCIVLDLWIFKDYAEIELYPAKNGNKWGYIDEDGDTIITPKYDVAKVFDGECALVNKEGQWGHIKKNVDKWELNRDFNFHPLNFTYELTLHDLQIICDCNLTQRHELLTRKGYSIAKCQADTLVVYAYKLDTSDRAYSWLRIYQGTNVKIEYGINSDIISIINDSLPFYDYQPNDDGSLILDDGMKLSYVNKKYIIFILYPTKNSNLWPILRISRLDD